MYLSEFTYYFMYISYSDVMILSRGGMYMANLLIIEDDLMTNEAICEYMKALGHNIWRASDGESGLMTARSESIDLIILDIMLPKLNGLEVLKNVRKEKDIPILMLTAMDDEVTQATSFDEQADDYITKPFSMLLLGKRVKALLRRYGKGSELKYLYLKDIVVDFQGYSARDKNGSIDITPKEIELLKLLVEHKGLVLTRSQILDEIWGYDYPIIDRIVDTYVKNLRKKLHLESIITVKGVGYKYEESL